MTDETHIQLGQLFGELDDVKPYVAAGRKNRLKYDELFDVSNVEEDGSTVDPNSPRGQANKVKLIRSTCARYRLCRCFANFFI